MDSRWQQMPYQLARRPKKQALALRLALELPAASVAAHAGHSRLNQQSTDF
jgi:hypothetical protein